MPDQRFPKSLRLRSRGDFRRVYERRAWVRDSLLKIGGCLGELPHPRLGLSVSRKVGNAVVRNRWKRLIREAFRLNRHKLPAGLDFIVVPGEGAKPELRSLAKSLENLAWKLQKKLKREAKRERQ